jgi:hypothetical protein
LPVALARPVELEFRARFDAMCWPEKSDKERPDGQVIMAGLTDVWSAVRKACARELFVLPPGASGLCYPHLLRLFEHCVAICKRRAGSWQSREGALMGMTVRLMCSQRLPLRRRWLTACPHRPSSVSFASRRRAATLSPTHSPRASERSNSAMPPPLRPPGCCERSIVAAPRSDSISPPPGGTRYCNAIPTRLPAAGVADPLPLSFRSHPP